jgi:acyl-coenzyme A synthetase/AMP-(fatty) acid ligase
VVRSPSISPGYYKDEESTAQTFVDGWLRTGDEAMFCKSPNGHEHVFITDRIKELIKVRGHQVSPTELEAFIITHPDVADCCVVPVPDALSGEAPKAFVVRAQGPETESITDDDLKQKIQKYVADNQTDYKRLKGGVEFIDIIPRDAGGKLLRRILKQRG